MLVLMLMLMRMMTMIFFFTRRKGILALRLLGRRLTPVSEDTARLAPKSIADGHPAPRQATENHRPPDTSHQSKEAKPDHMDTHSPAKRGTFTDQQDKDWKRTAKQSASRRRERATRSLLCRLRRSPCLFQTGPSLGKIGEIGKIDRTGTRTRTRPGTLLPEVAAEATTSGGRRIRIAPTPENIVTTLRTTLMYCVITTLLERVEGTINSPLDQARLQKLGIMEENNFLFLKWNQQTKQTKQHDKAQRDQLPMESVKQWLEQIKRNLIYPKVVMRFHVLRRLSPQVNSDIVPFTLKSTSCWSACRTAQCGTSSLAQ